MRMTHITVRYQIQAIAVLAMSILAAGCGPMAIPDRDPVGDAFPAVSGESLAGLKIELPNHFLGQEALYLVGYVQQTQFDIDRWTIGLIDAQVAAKIVEIPAIPGLVPTAISGWIDDGMRSGIPEEDWPAVITLYGSDAHEVAKLTGTENPRNTRVLLIDDAGVVRWFWDQGFSASRLIELRGVINQLSNQDSGT